MSKRRAALFLISALLLTLAGIVWGYRSKAESAPLGGSCDTSTPPPGMASWNIPDCFNVPVTRADCATVYGCWRLVSVVYESEQVSGGTHHIYTMEPHSPDDFMEVCTPNECIRARLDKPLNEPAGNIAMWAGGVYCVHLTGAPSDEICNLKMRGPTEDTEHQAHHISYKLTWEWRRETPLPFSVYLPLVTRQGEFPPG